MAYKEKGGCGRCCDRIPWPTIIAGLMMCLGTSIYCAFSYMGYEDLIAILTDIDNNTNWGEILKYIEIFVYASTAFLFVIVFVMLAMGCLATGSTRSNYICRFKSIFSGRCQLGMLIGLLYIFTIGWVFIICCEAIAVVFFAIIKYSQCYVWEEYGDEDYCVDLRTYGLIAYGEYQQCSDQPSDDSVVNPVEDVCLCGQELEDVCNAASEAGLFKSFFLGFVGSLLVLVSLIHYLMILSANYAHLRDRFKSQYVTRTSGHYSVGSFRSRDQLYRNSNAYSSRDHVAHGYPNRDHVVAPGYNSREHSTYKGEDGFRDSSMYTSSKAGSNDLSTLDGHELSTITNNVAGSREPLNVAYHI